MATRSPLPLSARAQSAAHEETLAKAMIGVASELRLADAGELMTMIRGDQAANIADLVNSSSELFFRSGALRYALNAGCCVQWDATPVARLDMEFRHADVCAFFRLVIGRSSAAVELVDVLFEGGARDAATQAERLAAALADARAPQA